MGRFILISTREHDLAASDEVRGVLDASGLDADALRVIRLEREPLGSLDGLGLEDCPGIILGGSPFNASDHPSTKSATQLRCEADLSRLLDVLVAEDFPFLGACYGVGTLGTHQGGRVDTHFGEPVGTSRIRLTDQGRRDPLLAGLPEEFDAFVGHKEAVSELPESAVLLADSAACPVQMFRVKSNLYATQFHPELDPAGLAQRIMIYRDAGYFPPQDAQRLHDEAMAALVEWPALILRNFVRRYGAES
ncbi:glutamine amidotransferase [Paeniglutamicibacter sulfureus]|uniref:GMP synthase (Glutamine-hydrolyzing) n=1 Tax=Paeniglutamicibacter sulfureus TaxID=43666 RepID=A0ABU2BH93_9MICC|nr:glutamine amidotransferase [Paeniglutamicibacter sulfureus]MDR7358014.1 GMP synthase (glutamine-hydrolyzing) [Paeniglutamicibacter sulfureus]